jgi:hypothetical protein
LRTFAKANQNRAMEKRNEKRELEMRVLYKLYEIKMQFMCRMQV